MSALFCFFKIIAFGLDLRKKMIYNKMEYKYTSDIFKIGGGLMKKKLIALVVLIAVFIPTYFAIAYYISAQNAPVAERTIEKLTVKDIDGEEFVFDKSGKDSKKMISFFVEMNDTADEVSQIPKQLKDVKYYEAVYRCYNKDKVYKYYFTKNPNEAYYVDPQRNTYNIDSELAIKFLSSRYAESIYESAVEPELTVSNMSVLAPYSINWKYKAGAGDFVSTTYKGDKVDSTEYPVSGSLQLAFTNQPDHITVKIMHGEKEIFNDVYENLTPAIIGETNKTFNIEVGAKWYENNEKDYYGEATYRFVANVSAPASFYLGEDTIEQGEFVVLTGKNVLDPKAVIFKSEPTINYTPTFYRDGDYVVALIPISVALEYSPSYVFTVSSGGVTEEFTLSVTERAKKGYIYSEASADMMNRTRTAAIVSAFNNAMKGIVTTNEATRYWNDVFTEPLDRNIRWGFGRTIVVNSTKAQFMNPGVDYVAVGGDQVTAVNGGKVVYVGEQIYSGKLVVVDHGFGLKSWYMNLSSTGVNVGDVVEKGGVLGIVGDTGFHNGTGVNLHYELTVHGVPVCPYSLNEEGIKMYLGE